MCVSLSVCPQLYPQSFRTHLINVGNFAKFTTLVHLVTSMNWSDFEVKKSQVTVLTTPDVVKEDGGTHDS